MDLIDKIKRGNPEVGDTQNTIRAPTSVAPYNAPLARSVTATFIRLNCATRKGGSICP